jgi:hypothetical protein
MKNTKIIKNLFTLLFATGLIFVLAACGSNEPSTDASDLPVENVADIDVYQDLQDVHAIVAEHLNWGDTAWEEIMLADDVPSPEMKYGLLVVPFFPSDLVERHSRTVSINNGNFVVEVVSAETGLIWTINQDGVIAGGN